jgi:hypothetical protein
MASTTARPQNVGIKAIEMYFPKRVSRRAVRWLRLVELYVEHTS